MDIYGVQENFEGLMKREAIFRNQFSKDLERIKRSGRDTTRLLEIIELLTHQHP